MSTTRNFDQVIDPSVGDTRTICGDPRTSEGAVILAIFPLCLEWWAVAHTDTTPGQIRELVRNLPAAAEYIGTQEVAAYGIREGDFASVDVYRVVA